MYKIGIDVGTSLTKLICLNEKNQILFKEINTDKDINNVIEEFITKNKIIIEEIELIGLTGIREKILNEKFKSIPSLKKEEFIATAEGATFLTKKDNILIASIGTGTAFIRKENEIISHIGGTGIGGGTLFNLCKIFAQTNSIEEIIDLAKKGDLNNSDIEIKDITSEQISNLNLDTTVCNFGKSDINTKKEDLVLATINMIIETIGVMSALALKNDKINEVVFSGTITTLPKVQEFLEKVEKLHEVKFIIPENSEYITALGTVIL